MLQMVLNAYKVHLFETGKAKPYLPFVYDYIANLLACKPGTNFSQKYPPSEDVILLTVHSCGSCHSFILFNFSVQIKPAEAAINFRPSKETWT